VSYRIRPHKRRSTVVAVQQARRLRVINELRSLAGAGLDVDEFRVQSLRRLRSLVTVDAAFYATVDDATMVMTSALSEEPLASAAIRFLDNEYAVDDVNKFTTVANLRHPVVSLDRATRGDRTTSARYRDLMAPVGLGDEARMALRARDRCWGVMCLHREDGEVGFSDDELTFFDAVAPVLGEGLRRGMAVSAATTGLPTVGGPGVLILGPDLSIRSMNPQAERWLAVADAPEWSAVLDLPVAVLSAAASVRDDSTERLSMRTRVHCREGGWMTVHASALRGDRDEVVVVLDRPEPEELTSLVLAAYGLTPAQTRVAALVLRGLSTRQIMRELCISANTVQEHLRAIFDRFGIGSRRELVAVLSAR
jgi:DNA-binding CsgD family transcriptional regulator